MRGTKGKRSEMINFFAQLDLSQLRPETYAPWLDEKTNELASIFDQNWGAARKGMNLLLRDILYCRETSEFYDMGEVEHLMECPLDSLTMSGIGKAAGFNRKPPAVSDLDPSTSERYQKAATDVARRLNTLPVHLDLKFWVRPTATS